MGGRVAIFRGLRRAVRFTARVTLATFRPDGASAQEGEQFGPAGDDYHPLQGDYLAIVDVPRQNGGVVVGAVDPVNPGQAEPGERRIYARDGSGAVIATIWAYNDGRVRVFNGNGGATLAADGSATVTTPSSSLAMSANGQTVLTNGAGTMTHGTDGSFDFNGFVISPSGLATDSNGTGFATHQHSQDADLEGDQQRDTNGPIEGS